MPDRTSHSVFDPTRRYRLVTLGGLALLREDGQPVTTIGPRNLLLLTYLALATKPLSRDHVAELFWGDREQDRARHSMREALSKVRQLLGPGAIPQRSDRVALDPAVPLSVDARALIAASAAGDSKTVVQLYRGPFLDGIHTSDCRTFEDWSDAERATYESRFTAACVVECARLREAGEWTECAELARRWLAAAPLDAQPALELLHALAAPGTRDALRTAAREYRQIAERLAADFELAPHPTVARAADQIARRTPAAEPDTPPVVAIAPRIEPRSATPEVRDRDQASQPRVRSAFNRRRIAWVSAASLGIVLVLLLSRAIALRSAETDNGMLAIMPFDVIGQSRDSWLAAGAPRLLGAAISREHVVNVVEQAQLREMLPARDLARAPSSADAAETARKLGARWMLTGSVTVGGGHYWLDASLVDVRNRIGARHMTVGDTALVTVIAQATARVVAGIDVHDSGEQFAELEPNTVNAYRSYMRAVRLREQMRTTDVAAALDEAIAADSGFVAAVMERRYMLATAYTRAAIDSARSLDNAYFKHRARTTEFERLDFEAYLALHTGDHARAEALGRALLARYPRDPRAFSRFMETLSLHGRFGEALSTAEDAIVRDSATRSTARAVVSDECNSCAAYRGVSEIARMTGDLPRAEFAARRAASMEPEDPEAWAQLGAVLAARGRYVDAVAAARRAGALAPTDPAFAMDAIRRLIEARRYAEADSALSGWKSSNDPGFALTAAELEALLLRERGQLGGAAHILDVALRRYPADSGWLLLVQGDTRARMGDAVGAERSFLAAVPPEPPWRTGNGASNYPADWARTYAWPRALLADALWETGNRDTVRLAALADSIQAIGARSYFGRDWRLYHHVRGLIAMSGRHWARAEQEFQAARWARAGWQRTIIELARAQIEQGRAADAVATLRDAYTAQLAAMGLYVPRSELDFEMARAFAAAGAADSARVYARYTMNAWQNADPRVHRRLAELAAFTKQ